jgi:RNA polymerase sigma-70 factor (ECF subfamily)
VYRVLDRLPEEDRRVLILCELEELGAEEVGKLLGIKPGHARVRLHRARAKFMRAYQQEFKAATDPPGERCRHVGR